MKEFYLISLIAFIFLISPIHFLAITFALALGYLIYLLIKKIAKQQKIKELSRYLSLLIEEAETKNLKFIHPAKETNLRAEQLEQAIINQLVINNILIHTKTLLRKRKQNIYTDDYDNIVKKSWNRECLYFIKNVICEIEIEPLLQLSPDLHQRAFHQLNASNKEMLEHWKNFVDSILDDLEPHYPQDQNIYLPRTGHDYERYVAKIIEEYAWTARVTKGSGDHGADIIAEKNEIRLAAQCKKYSTPVGNKSVQEAFSAKQFYDCQYACVITNTSFTPAARKAADKLGVALLHHEDVGDYLESLENP